MKKVIIGFLIIFYFSCGTQSDYYFNEKTISELSGGDFELPSKYSNIPLFIKTTSNEVGILNINTLHDIYNQYYSNEYHEYKEFVFDALNQKIKLEKQKIESEDVDLFFLDEEIKLIYDKNGFSKFMDMYAEGSKTKNLYTLNKEHSSNPMLNSILYYFFINGYQVTLDDNIGKYYIRPLLSSI